MTTTASTTLTVLSALHDLPTADLPAALADVSALDLPAWASEDLDIARERGWTDPQTLRTVIGGCRQRAQADVDGIPRGASAAWCEVCGRRRAVVEEFPDSLYEHGGEQSYAVTDLACGHRQTRDGSYGRHTAAANGQHVDSHNGAPVHGSYADWTHRW